MKRSDLAVGMRVLYESRERWQDWVMGQEYEILAVEPHRQTARYDRYAVGPTTSGQGVLVKAVNVREGYDRPQVVQLRYLRGEVKACRKIQREAERQSKIANAERISRERENQTIRDRVLDRLGKVSDVYTGTDYSSHTPILKVDARLIEALLDAAGPDFTYEKAS